MLHTEENINKERYYIHRNTANYVQKNTEQKNTAMHKSTTMDTEEFCYVKKNTATL